MKPLKRNVLTAVKQFLKYSYNKNLMLEEIRKHIKEQVSALPMLPGVYQFFNKDGVIIYVGKAKSLRQRVSSYFVESKEHSVKVRIMIRHIVNIEHIIVSSESDALLLENNLIKRLKPRYNILLKDDKTYPWIVVRNEPFPRVESTRSLLRDGAKYYGPYSSVSVQRNLLELIHNIYPIRTCALNLSEKMIAKGNYTRCLQFHIGNCKAPCISNQLPSDYMRDIEMVKNILSGELKIAKRYLEEKIATAANELNFELAHNLKCRLDLLEKYRGKSIIVSNTLNNLDVFGILIEGDIAYCNFVRIISGGVISSFTVEFSLGAEEDQINILTSAIIQISEKTNEQLNSEIIVPFLPHVELFPNKEFKVPQKGDKLKLLEFAERNCRLFKQERLKNMEIKEPDKHITRVMSAMKRELHMDVEPKYIECFDNSNLQGTNPVAACVVFRDGKPSRTEYRHFNIKTVIGPDDFASMKEVLTRRYSRLLSENKQLPDLIVVDGGKGQLSAAYEVLCDLGVADRIKIVGLAKRIEEVFFPNDSEPYYLSRKGEPLRILMFIRDEAHRFGVTFHRNKRSKGFINSELEQIPRLGEVSITKLLKRFKTISAIKKATTEELNETIGASRAKSVKEHFNS